MPKLVGHSPHEKNVEIPSAYGRGLVKLSFSQKRLLPQDQVFCVYDTSDRGSKNCLAKRWWQWFATPVDIIGCSKSTECMIAKAESFVAI